MAFWDSIVSALNNGFLGIPQGQIRKDLPESAFMPAGNAAGDVVFPVGILERALQGSDSATKDYAASFLGGPALKGIRAYHGSPYDFSKFDLSRIGTGEGAQAYGHGLYFAENPAVAESYKITGRQMPPLSPRIGGSEHLPPPPPGKMYEVNINAKPEQFLQWDKPLAQQSPEVKSIVDQLWKANPNWRPRWGLTEPIQGSDVYWEGSKSGSGGRASRSQAMNEAGIPGIRYLDQGSRNVPQISDLARTQSKLDALTAAGKGDSAYAAQLRDWVKMNTPTSNYVVFNPDIVDILRKYGLVGALGASQLTPQGNEQ